MKRRLAIADFVIHPDILADFLIHPDIPLDFRPGIYI
jgi:hypothetical protein